MRLTRKVAQKVLATVDAGLCSGVGIPEPGKMCVEAAVSYALGRDHGDDPGCVSQVLRALKITLNDAVWSSNIARANGLRKLAILQLGTAEGFDEGLFLEQLVDVTIRKIVPRALRATSLSSLEASAVLCETEGTLRAAKSAESAAWSARSAALSVRSAAKSAAKSAESAAKSAAWSAPWSAAKSAAESAAWSAESAAWSAAKSAENAAESAAESAAWSAAESAAWSAAYDAELVFFADCVADILISMKVPGVKWLDLL